MRPAGLAAFLFGTLAATGRRVGSAARVRARRLAVISSVLVDELVAGVAAELGARIRVELEGLFDGVVVAEPWRLLSLEEAAGRLGRSTRWVRERVSRGDLPHVRLDGGALAFELDDLRAFAAARRADAAAGVLAGRLQSPPDVRRGAGSPRDLQPRRLRVSDG